MPSTDIAVRWRVRPGRECRVCGWALLADMVRSRCKPDGFDTICRRCTAARATARRSARRAAGLCVWEGCPHEAVSGRGGLCDAHAEAKSAAQVARCAAKVAVGICRDCSRPAVVGASRCTEHFAAHTERARDRIARYTARTDEEIAAKRAALRSDGLKRCRKCALRLPFEAFALARAKADGLHDDCRACSNTRLLKIAAPRWRDDDLVTCVYCGAPFEHADHVWPSADGGPDHPHNLVPACESCNTSKRGSHVLDFVARRLGSDVVDAVLAWPVRYVDLDEELS